MSGRQAKAMRVHCVDETPSRSAVRPTAARALVAAATGRAGAPLDAAVRFGFEQRLGQDLSAVRVHSDDETTRAADSVGARAYTIGRHIAFKEGLYAPGTAEGDRLLAHELTHVIQQQAFQDHQLAGAPILGPDHPSERQAHSGDRPTPLAAPAIQRDGSDAPKSASRPTAPPYLADLDRRLRRQVDKDVRFFAEESGPVEELTRKYGGIPWNEEALLDIPDPVSEPTDWSLEGHPHARFRLHSQLTGGYEFVAYDPPKVVIARDGIGYVINDGIFAWKFGQDLPDMYESFEGPMIYRHEHPFLVLFATKVAPQVMGGALAFLAPELEAGALVAEEAFAESEGTVAVSDVAAQPRAGPIGETVPPPIVGEELVSEPLAILPDGSTAPPDSYSGGFYGTTEPPELVMKDGLPGRGTDMRLREHSEGSPKSGFRGTTNIASDGAGRGAAYWAGDGGYVYEIRDVPTWDVNKNLQGRVDTGGGYRGNLMHGEGEYAIPARVPPDKIVRWGVVRDKGGDRLFVEWH